MMPATWVPWPLPRSVLETGPLSTGTTRVLEESGGTLAYSALSSVTLCLTRFARSGWVASQPESTTPTVTPLPVKPLLRSEFAAAALDDIAFVEAGVEQLDPLVGVDVLGDAGGDGRLHRGGRARDERHRQPLHRLHGEPELLQRADVGRRRQRATARRSRGPTACRAARSAVRPVGQLDGGRRGGGGEDPGPGRERRRRRRARSAGSGCPGSFMRTSTRQRARWLRRSGDRSCRRRRGASGR